MSSINPKKIRFYINYPAWSYSINDTSRIRINEGITSNLSSNDLVKLLQLNPSTHFSQTNPNDHGFSVQYYGGKEGINFVFWLGHTFNDYQNNIYVGSNNSTTFIGGENDYKAINWTSNGGYPDYDGFSAVIFDNVKCQDELIRPAIGGGTQNPNKFICNSICLGKYYDLPVSADMKIQQNVDYSGVESTETLGGSILTNSHWVKPPNWNGLAPWNLHDPTETIVPNYAPSGRRSWRLKFSYLNDSDLLPTNRMSNNFESGVALEDDLSNLYDNTYVDNNDFFTNVIDKTHGGKLPFIMQLDNTSFTPDDFVVCKFEMSSFKMTQVAHKIYSIALNIKEYW